MQVKVHYVVMCPRLFHFHLNVVQFMLDLLFLGDGEIGKDMISQSQD